MKKWWRRSRNAAPIDDSDRYKRLPPRVRGRVGREIRRAPLSHDRRGSWDEQSEFITRYGDPFE